jgi:hypothetical protein
MIDTIYLAQEIEACLPDVSEERREQLLSKILSEVGPDHHLVNAQTKALALSYWFYPQDELCTQRLAVHEGVSLFRHENQDIWHAQVPLSVAHSFVVDLSSWCQRWGQE